MLPARPVAARFERDADDLLTEFSATGREECFEEIVRRYGAMVLSVCQRETRHRQDAEDATQVVFLVLAERLRAGEKIRSPGAWLQQVGRRAAADIRRSRARRRRREREHAAPEITHTPFPSDDEAVARLVREELDHIPAKYRIPLILHYFNGQNFVDAAGVLGIKPSTLGVRIFRGRKLLGKRLARRGLELSGVALVGLLATVVRRSVSEALVKSVARVAITGGAGASVSAGPVALGQGLAVFAASSQVKVLAIAALLAAAAVGARAAVQWRPELPGCLDPRKIMPSIPNLRSNLPGLRADAAHPAKPAPLPDTNTELAPQKNVASPVAEPIAPWLARSRPIIGPRCYSAPPHVQPFPGSLRPGLAAGPIAAPYRVQPIAAGAPAPALPPPPARQRGGNTPDDIAAKAAPGHVAAGSSAPGRQDPSSPHESPGSFHATGPRNASGPMTGGSPNGPALNPNPPADGVQTSPPNGAHGPGASFPPNSILGPGLPGPDGPPILGPGASTGPPGPGSQLNTDVFWGPDAIGPHLPAPGLNNPLGDKTGSVIAGDTWQYSTGGAVNSIHYNSVVTPEPAGVGLITVGAIGLLLRRRRSDATR